MKIRLDETRQRHAYLTRYLQTRQDMGQLEHIAIANALQLEAAPATPALSCFNYDAMPSLKSLNLSNAVLQRFCC